MFQPFNNCALSCLPKGEVLMFKNTFLIFPDYSRFQVWVSPQTSFVATGVSPIATFLPSAALVFMRRQHRRSNESWSIPWQEEPTKATETHTQYMTNLMEGIDWEPPEVAEIGTRVPMLLMCTVSLLNCHAPSCPYFWFLANPFHRSGCCLLSNSRSLRPQSCKLPVTNTYQVFYQPTQGGTLNEDWLP